MSRIGKKLIQLPSGVTVDFKESVFTVRGPKGELSFQFAPTVLVETEEKDSGSFLKISVNDSNENGALWGTSRALVANMIKGVSDGWKKTLELNGVGFKMDVKGNKLVMRLGFSHEVEFLLPDGIEAVIDGNVLTISGVDRQLVGQTASEIRSLKKPEPYKGKGFKYQEEVIRRKAGKAAKGE